MRKTRMVEVSYSVCDYCEKEITDYSSTILRFNDARPEADLHDGCVDKYLEIITVLSTDKGKEDEDV